MNGKRLVVYGLTALAAMGALGAAWWGTRAALRAPAPALPDSTASFDAMTDAYGPSLYSQGHEETLIRAFFQDRREGFFVDVGASHYEKDSTTYYLERHLGWLGIAIDAIEEFRAGYEQFRKGTRFFSFFVTNQDGAPRDFFVYTRDTRISTGDLERLRGLPRVKDRYIEATQVPSVTLNQLLGALEVERVDFVSMDIEGAELEALEGFDIERYGPELLCMEIQDHTRERVLRYFHSHGYVPIKRYRDVDHVNFYFRRKSATTSS
jgi:FkbM family methyltransferase